jgi:hypothetical protein
MHRRLVKENDGRTMPRSAVMTEPAIHEKISPLHAMLTEFDPTVRKS